ncbi:MAG: GNVR domain-containing protein [Flavobacteriaceae bacterium]
MRETENKPQVFEDDSIDLIALLSQVFKSRWFIIKMSSIAFVIGVIVALATPNIYTSGATFIPQTGSDPKPSSSLSGLASLAGISFGGMSNGSDIPPTLYPQVVSSIPYKLELLNTSIEKTGTSILLRDYLDDDSGVSVLEFIKKYTIGLPGLILSTLKGSDIEGDFQKRGVYQISADDKSIFEKLNSKLILSLNEKEGFVTLSFSDEDKFVASQVAESAKELLQQRIINFKNQSAREVLIYTTKQYQENKTYYEALQDSIAIFKDQNLNISSSLYQNRLDRLERELNIASSVLEQLASQVEQAKLQVNKDTPVFTIIEPATVPFERSAPKRSLIVVIWTFLGAVLSTGYVLIREPASEIFQSIKKGEA